MTPELIAGQCENCGSDYQFEAVLGGAIICPACKQETQNWDTVGHSQMAPFIVKITR